MTAPPGNGAPAVALTENRMAGIAEDEMRCTELGNAERFVLAVSDGLGLWGPWVRYVTPWGKWLLWDGKRWKVDRINEVFPIAQDVVKEIYREAAAAQLGVSRTAGSHPEAESRRRARETGPREPTE